MENRKGEIITLLTVGAVVIIGISAIASSFFVNQKKTTQSKAAEVAVAVCDAVSKTSFSCAGRSANECIYDEIQAHAAYSGNDQAYQKYLTCCGDGFWHVSGTKPTGCGASAPAAPPANQSAPPAGGSCGGVKTGYGGCSGAGSCVYRTYAAADPHYFNQWIYCCDADKSWYAKDSNSQDPAKGWQTQPECVAAGGPKAPAAPAPVVNTAPAVPPANSNNTIPLEDSVVTAPDTSPATGCLNMTSEAACVTTCSTVVRGGGACSGKWCCPPSAAAPVTTCGGTTPTRVLCSADVCSVRPIRNTEKQYYVWSGGSYMEDTCKESIDNLSSYCCNPIEKKENNNVSISGPIKLISVGTNDITIHQALKSDGEASKPVCSTWADAGGNFNYLKCPSYCDSKGFGGGKEKGYYQNITNKGIYFSDICESVTQSYMTNYCGCDTYKKRTISFTNQCQNTTLTFTSWCPWNEPQCVPLNLKVAPGQTSPEIDATANGTVGCSNVADLHYNGETLNNVVYYVYGIDCSAASSKTVVNVGGGIPGVLAVCVN